LATGEQPESSCASHRLSTKSSSIYIGSLRRSGNPLLTVQGSFEVSNTYDKEFNRLAQTFGMTAEYARLKGETDHNVLPDVGRSLPDQAFDATQDSKKIQVHPMDPNKTTSVAVNLDPA
jgi:hypothetical protein